MKKTIIRIASLILTAALSAAVISSCASDTAQNAQTADSAQPAAKPAEMQQIFKESWESNVAGEFDTDVTLGGNEYHITSTALNNYSDYISTDYQITINDASVMYNTEGYYHIEYAYLADINPDDDSVILFLSPLTDNDYLNMTAYKYSPATGIVQLSFDIDGDGVTEPTLEPGRHYSDFNLSDDGTFSLVTGSKSLGMWGLQRYFRLDDNDVLVFEQADKYQIKYWADGTDMLQIYDREADEPRIMTYEEAKENMMYNIDSEQDYEMLLQGYYHCKQSCDDLREGDFFKFVYDDNNGNVTFVTSDGREGRIDVNAIGPDQTRRNQIGGFALMLAG